MTETVETVIARAIVDPEIHRPYRQFLAGRLVPDLPPYPVNIAEAKAVIAALDAAGYIITRKAPMTADEFEAWPRERHRTVGGIMAVCMLAVLIAVLAGWFLHQAFGWGMMW